MQIKRSRLCSSVLSLSLLLMVGMNGRVLAAQSSSTNYSVNEVQMGAGGSVQDCATTYCAKTSVGDTVVGSGKSTNYSAQFGYNTTAEPLLEVTANSGTNNLGVLNTSTTGTATATVSVRSYLISGYVMQITGNAPSQGTHTLTSLATQSTSQPGTEQFGMNLVANTTPAVGANPVQVPDSTFSFGTANSNYGTANLFRYVNGDIVAQSSVSTGETDYTISMILNISNATPGGQYTGNFSAVVTPTF